jgi:hypothetical protein
MQTLGSRCAIPATDAHRRRDPQPPAHSPGALSSPGSRAMADSVLEPGHTHVVRQLLAIPVPSLGQPEVGVASRDAGRIEDSIGVPVFVRRVAAPRDMRWDSVLFTGYCRDISRILPWHARRRRNPHIKRVLYSK